jgi:hypothetical protein
MDTLLVPLAALALGFALALLVRRGPGADGVDAVRRDLKGLSERLSAESTQMAVRLEGLDTRLLRTQTANQDLAQSIFDSLGDVRRATVSVAEQAQQFTALQDLLRAPKARGALGEAMLEELLRQVLPPKSYTMQHRFRTGTIVDAVIRAGGRLVCIDSKFPLSNYRLMCSSANDVDRADAERAFAADVFRHIKDISTRYILPDEGTLDFAMMYVPAEGVYAEILRLNHKKRPLFETAIEARVVPMSPLTMYAYLQTVRIPADGALRAQVPPDREERRGRTRLLWASGAGHGSFRGRVRDPWTPPRERMVPVRGRRVPPRQGSGSARARVRVHRYRDRILEGRSRTAARSGAGLNPRAPNP